MSKPERCIIKQKYFSLEEAQTAANALIGIRQHIGTMEPYHCKVHNCYHVVNSYAKAMHEWHTKTWH